MTVDDRNRLRLLRQLETVLGEEEAATLMEHLPPVTWQNVATKDDLDALRISFKQEIDALASGMRAEMATFAGDLRAEMATLGGDLRGEMTTSESGLRGEMATMGSDLRAEMAEIHTGLLRAINAQTWRLMGFLAGWSAVLVTVVGIIG